MYDGRKWIGRQQVPDPSTTFVVTMCDEGKRNTIDDEWCVDYAFSIPDDGKRVLPVTFRNLSGTQTVASIWSSESTPFRGGTFTVTDTVQNQGGLTAPASTTRYYLSADAQRGAGDILLTGSRAVAGLAPGASSPGAPVTVTIPSATPASAYYVLACADDTKVVTEASEGNCRASATAVTVSR
jgi:hypothetical protein